MKETLSNIQKEQGTIQGLLKESGKKELVAFVAEYAALDMDFANAIRVRFGKPAFNKELEKMQSRIISALEDVSDYRTHDSWGYADFDVSHILFEIRERMEQGHLRLAFAETELLYRELLANFEYQDECEISDEAENCLDIMSGIADKAASPEDQNFILRQCVALTDLEEGREYGADYEDRLLSIAAKVVTPETLGELEHALTALDTGYYEETVKLIRIDIIRKMQGEKEADAFIQGNLHFPKIREIAFASAMARKDFGEAERLCVDFLSVWEHSGDDALVTYQQHMDVTSWLRKLYSVYEATENLGKLAETAEKLLLRGETKYYDATKQALQKQALWEQRYPVLLRKCEEHLSHRAYMDILVKENEDALLFEQVGKHPEEIFTYGKRLAQTYKPEICAIFTGKINQQAESAYGRDEYRHVCSRILRFAEAGYRAEAGEMVSAFSRTYSRKPAFVDELTKIAKEAGM